MSSAIIENIKLPFFGNLCFTCHVPRSPGGAFRDRHGRWERDAMDASVRLDEARDADGETVWSWPPDAEVKFCETLAERRWLSKPGHRGERGIDRKPSRRECRLFRPCLW